MIRLIVDSTCDLPKDILETYQIAIAPLTIVINDERFEDYKDISPDEFYEIISKSDNIPTTEAPSAQKFIDLFRDGVMNGIDEFIVITISSVISETYELALQAKKEFEENNMLQGLKIHVEDSLCIGHGSGYLAMKAALMREAGASFDEIVAFIKKYKTRIRHLLSISDVNTLVKSGKSSVTKAKIAKLLGVEAIIENKKGIGAVTNKVIGRKNVLKYYTDEFNKTFDKEMTDFVIIGYTSDITYAKDLREYFIKNSDFRGQIFIMQMGASIGAHIGLGGLSMFFISQNSGNALADIFNFFKISSK